MGKPGIMKRFFVKHHDVSRHVMGKSVAEGVKNWESLSIKTGSISEFSSQIFSLIIIFVANSIFLEHGRIRSC